MARAPYLIWLFVLVCFTGADGAPVWIAKEQVTAIVRTPKGSSPESQSQVLTTSGVSLFVKEAPNDVAEKMK